MLRASVISLALAAPVSAQTGYTFVALAFDEYSLIHAYAVGTELQSAQAEALDECKQHSQACKLVYTRANQCMSLAASVVSGVWAANVGETIVTADENALTSCTEFNEGNACRVIGSRCPDMEQEKI